MNVEAALGNLAPDLDPAVLPTLPRKPNKRQHAGLQALRNIFACTRSEAARHGPLRCDTLCVLLGKCCSLPVLI
jgi:hypothetical protein